MWIQIFISAVYCPPLPEPVVETWDSFAVLKEWGKVFRQCRIESSFQFCPLVNVSLTASVDLTDNNIDAQHDNYEIGSPSNVSAISITFSSKILFATPVRRPELNVYLSKCFYWQ